MLEHVDLVLLDVKAVDENVHKTLTGRNNKGVFQFLDLCETLSKDVVIRHVMVPTINDDAQSVAGLSEKLQAYTCIERIDVLPYHTQGTFKWENLNEIAPLKGVPAMNKTLAKDYEKTLNECLKSFSKTPVAPRYGSQKHK